MGDLTDPRQIWDERYARSRQLSDNYEPWLGRWLALLEARQETPILNLGCRLGLDAQYLAARGYRVIAADYSWQALQTARHRARVVQLDHGRGLPFAHGAFQVIVANLSLHYLRWRRTRQVVASLCCCLQAGGLLLARFNSTQDYNHGAAGHVELEAHCFVVQGVLKRFFDGPDLDRLFRRGWKMRSLQEQTVHCYTRPKVVWEVVVERNDVSLDRQRALVIE
jgi:SAM-dependent methyltransferase